MQPKRMNSAIEWIIIIRSGSNVIMKLARELFRNQFVTFGSTLINLN